MSSVTISELIILIASTLLAGSFATYAIFYGNLVQNSMSSSIDSIRQQLNVRVRIVHATISDIEGCFVIYAKNVGLLPIPSSSLPYIDLYVGPYRRASLYRYSPNSQNPGYFQAYDANGDGIWEVGETAIFKAFYGSGPLSRGELYEAKICLRSGLGDSYLFTLP